MQETIIQINTIGLVLGFLGALILLLISPQLVRINHDGSMSMGPESGESNEDWRRSNRILRRIQKYLVPVCYLMIAVGFAVQLFGLWLPKLCGQ